MENEKISVLLHSATGIIAGVVSNFLGAPVYALGAAIIVLYATGRTTEFVAEKEGFKWWLGNGVVPFLFIWLISWILLFNI